MIEGIDVSRYQGQIDWHKVLMAGKTFAICKATQGISRLDPFFQGNIQGASDAGLVVGAYHFFDPKEDAKTQAQFFLNQVKNFFPLIPVLDVEDADGWSDMTMEDRGNAVQEFLDEILSQTKTHPVIYTYASFADANLVSVPFGAYKLWLARYAEIMPQAWSGWTLWQYGFKGTVDGIPTQVDLDRFNGSLSDLKAICAQGIVA